MAKKQNKKGNKMPRKVAANRRNRQNLDRSGIGMQMTEEYFNSLIDPFSCRGPRLGWGCMVPSTVVTMYGRGTAPVGPDGSLALMVVPAAVGTLRVWNAGLSSTTQVVIDSQDATSMDSNFNSGRVVSIGLRAVPSIALTDQPGFCYSGAIEGLDTGAVVGLATRDFANFPQVQQSVATTGACATGRPQDPDSFIFVNSVVNSGGPFILGNEEDLLVSLPVISFEGLPLGTSVGYEFIVNVECLQRTGRATAAVLGLGSIGETLAKYWPSFEKMWSYIQPALPAPAKSGTDSWFASGVRLAGRVGSGLIGSALQYGVQGLLSSNKSMFNYPVGQKMIGY
jgi:hypothetical protein